MLLVASRLPLPMDKCIVDKEANLMPPPHIGGRVALPAVVGVEQRLANLSRLNNLLAKSLEVDAPGVLSEVRQRSECLHVLPVYDEEVGVSC